MEELSRKRDSSFFAENIKKVSECCKIFVKSLR